METAEVSAFSLQGFVLSYLVLIYLKLLFAAESGNKDGYFCEH